MILDWLFRVIYVMLFKSLLVSDALVDFARIVLNLTDPLRAISMNKYAVCLKLVKQILSITFE